MTGWGSRKGGIGGPLFSSSSISQEKPGGQERPGITWGPSAGGAGCQLHVCPHGAESWAGLHGGAGLRRCWEGGKVRAPEVVVVGGAVGRAPLLHSW